MCYNQSFTDKCTFLRLWVLGFFKLNKNVWSFFCAVLLFCINETMYCERFSVKRCMIYVVLYQIQHFAFHKYHYFMLSETQSAIGTEREQ